MELPNYKQLLLQTQPLIAIIVYNKKYLSNIFDSKLIHFKKAITDSKND